MDDQYNSAFAMLSFSPESNGLIKPLTFETDEKLIKDKTYYYNYQPRCGEFIHVDKDTNKYFKHAVKKMKGNWIYPRVTFTYRNYKRDVTPFTFKHIVKYTKNLLYHYKEYDGHFLRKITKLKNSRAKN